MTRHPRRTPSRGGLRLRAIVLLGLVCLVGNRLQAQDSAALHKPLVEPSPMLAGMGLLASGTAFTFIPSWHEAIQRPNRSYASHDWPRFHFDDYLQYAPTALPFALKAFGLRGEHSIERFTLLAALSYGLGGSVARAVKNNVSVERPSGMSFNSFPSGHSFVSFVGAELVRREYGRDYPWIAVGAYTLASLTAFMRFHNNMHWLSDIAAGIGLAVASVSLTYGLDAWWERYRTRHRAASTLSLNSSNTLCDGYILHRF